MYCRNVVLIFFSFCLYPATLLQICDTFRGVCIAQLWELSAHIRLVAGSNPAAPTKFPNTQCGVFYWHGKASRYREAGKLGFAEVVTMWNDTRLFLSNRACNLTELICRLIFYRIEQITLRAFLGRYVVVIRSAKGVFTKLLQNVLTSRENTVIPLILPVLPSFSA